jgi:aryl-alcohol dehydrogenase-like predicted oxidoreductase
LQVSELCLGTMNFGPRTAETEAHAILNKAVDQGINFIDTANQYGGEKGVGATEEIIGNWIAKHPAKRKHAVLATKVYEPMSADINDRGLSARHIVQSCEDSLTRLQTDHIDLLQMHHLDRHAPIEEIWQAMDLLIQHGKITYVGSSNFPGWMIAQTNERAQYRNRLGLVSEQSKYNLLERRIELEVLPACRHYGVGLIIWSPLAGGSLAKPSDQGEGRRGSPQSQQDRAQHRSALEAFAQFCDGIATPPSAVALSWVLHQDAVTSAAIGPATQAQLDSAIAASELTLSKAHLEELDQIFPPCGEAPEAYAW